MEIEITSNGITRTFQGSYEELHNLDWNQRVQELLDSALEYDRKVPR